jgi:hypothetical protein
MINGPWSLSDADKEGLIVRGRALVRLIEAGKVLLTFHQDADERVRYGLAVEAAQAQLRQMVAEVDSAMAAPIIAASETVLGPVGDVTVN